MEVDSGADQLLGTSIEAEEVDYTADEEGFEGTASLAKELDDVPDDDAQQSFLETSELAEVRTDVLPRYVEGTPDDAAMGDDVYKDIRDMKDREVDVNGRYRSTQAFTRDPKVVAIQLCN